MTRKGIHSIPTNNKMLPFFGRIDLDGNGDTLHSLLSTQYVVPHICPKGHVHEIHQNSLYNPLPIKQSSSLVDSLEDLKYDECLSDYLCTDCQPQTGNPEVLRNYTI